MFDTKPRISGLCDIHCHILPAVDDGPKDMEQSLLMCRQAVADGISTIIATPHFNDRFQRGEQELKDALGGLRAAIAEEGLPLEILLGADVAAAAGLRETVAGRPWLTVAGQGRYILVEPPCQVMPSWVNDLVFELRIDGLGVIITHPERNSEVQQNPNVILPLVQSGVLVQITADSIMGTFGPETRKCAVSLLKMNAVHFIATDAHSADFRCPRLRDAVEKARKYVGDEAVKLARENPFAVARGEPVAMPDPVPLRSLFGRMAGIC